MKPRTENLYQLLNFEPDGFQTQTFLNPDYSASRSDRSVTSHPLKEHYLSYLMTPELQEEHRRVLQTGRYYRHNFHNINRVVILIYTTCNNNVHSFWLCTILFNDIRNLSEFILQITIEKTNLLADNFVQHDAYPPFRLVKS